MPATLNQSTDNRDSMSITIRGSKPFIQTLFRSDNCREHIPHLQIQESSRIQSKYILVRSGRIIPPSPPYAVSSMLCAIYGSRPATYLRAISHRQSAAAQARRSILHAWERESSEHQKVFGDLDLIGLRRGGWEILQLGRACVGCDGEPCIC